MAREWRERSFGDLTENFDGVRRPVKEADRRPGPFPYYGASGVVDHVDGYLFDGEYLLVAEDGENLRSRNTPVAFLARGKFWVNNHAHVVRGNAHADTRFLMYALAATAIRGYLTGSTMPKLTQGNLNRIPLLVPPLREQRAIAHVLGTLDDKIELNRRMSETLEAMAGALFKSWFVDFDPVRAKAEGREPGLPKHLADLFPDRFEESEIGEVPAGWTVGTIAGEASMRREGVAPQDAPEELFAHCSIPAFDAGRLPIMERGAAIKSMKFRVPPEAVLVSKLNPEIDRVWLVDGKSEPTTICSTEFFVLEPTPPVPRAYLYCQMRSPLMRERLLSLVTGTSGSHQRVRPAAFLDLPAAHPTAPALDAFDRIAAPLLAASELRRVESTTLRAIREALLPKLISGEIRVSVAEHRVEACA